MAALPHLPPSGVIDVAAYLRRVGLADVERSPTLATLRVVQRAHLSTISFNSVAYALGRLPSLDLPTVQRRIVAEGRGGTCLEQVPLFAAVLDAMGFQTRVRMAAWRCGAGEPVTTHLVVLVRVIDDDRIWLADVGWGVSVLAPVPLPPGPGRGEPVRLGHWEQRADVAADGEILLMERGAPPSADQWRRMHAASDEDPKADAMEWANRFGATDPRSPFVGRLVAIRVTEETRERLNGRDLEIYDGGEPRIETLAPAVAVETLERRFHVAVDDEERAALIRLLERT